MNEGPQRIQLSRRRGWRMPAHTLKVDRSTLWGNPFRVGDDGILTVEQAVRMFRRLTEWDAEELARSRYFMFSRPRIQSALRGYNLACWCRPGTPCHADILLEIANGPPRDESPGNSEKQSEDVHVSSNQEDRRGDPHRRRRPR